MDRQDGLDGKPVFVVLLVSVLFTPQALMTSPAWIKQHGGAAAILPYVIGVLVLGIPLVFLELSLGQFMQRSGTRLWAVAPLFKGLAICSMLTSLVRSSVNCVMAAWAGIYIYLTLTNQIPSCNTTSLNHPMSQSNENNIHNQSITIGFQSTPSWSYNDSSSISDRIDGPNQRLAQNDFSRRGRHSFPLAQRSSNQTNDHSTTSSEKAWDFNSCEIDFVRVWRNDLLQTSSSITAPGRSVLQLFIGNAAVVFVSLFVSVFGVGVMRKILTSLLPVVMAISAALVTYACLWDASDVSRRLSSVWSADFGLLTRPDTWFSCCHHILITHGLSIGVLPSLSSYLKWNNNTFRDAVVTSLLTVVINLFSSLLIFVVMVPVRTLDSEEPFHLFTSIPLSLSLFSHHHVWIVLFFLLLIVVIVTTNALYWEVAILAVTDASKKLSKWRVLIVLGAASLVFLLTIPMSLQNGVYIFRLLEFVVFGPFLVGVVGLVQLLVMAFVYGGHKFYDNLETMTGYRPHWWMRFSWAWVCPGLVLVSMCYHGHRVYSSPIVLGTSDPFPDLSNMLMVVVTGLLLLPVPLAAVWVLCSGPVGCLKKLKWSVQPRLQPFQIPIRWRLDRKWHKFSPL